MIRAKTLWLSVPSFRTVWLYQFGMIVKRCIIICQEKTQVVSGKAIMVVDRPPLPLKSQDNITLFLQLLNPHLQQNVQLFKRIRLKALFVIEYVKHFELKS